MAGQRDDSKFRDPEVIFVVLRDGSTKVAWPIPATSAYLTRDSLDTHTTDGEMGTAVLIAWTIWNLGDLVDNTGARRADGASLQIEIYSAQGNKIPMGNCRSVHDLATRMASDAGRHNHASLALLRQDVPDWPTEGNPTAVLRQFVQQYLATASQHIIDRLELPDRHPLVDLLPEVEGTMLTMVQASIWWHQVDEGQNSRLLEQLDSSHIRTALTSCIRFPDKDEHHSLLGKFCHRLHTEAVHVAATVEHVVSSLAGRSQSQTTPTLAQTPRFTLPHVPSNKPPSLLDSLEHWVRWGKEKVEAVARWGTHAAGELYKDARDDLGRVGASLKSAEKKYAPVVKRDLEDAGRDVERGVKGVVHEAEHLEHEYAPMIRRDFDEVEAGVERLAGNAVRDVRETYHEVRGLLNDSAKASPMEAALTAVPARQTGPVYDSERGVYRIDRSAQSYRTEQSDQATQNYQPDPADQGYQPTQNYQATQSYQEAPSSYETRRGRPIPNPDTPNVFVHPSSQRARDTRPEEQEPLYDSSQDTAPFIPDPAGRPNPASYSRASNPRRY